MTRDPEEFDASNELEESLEDPEPDVEELPLSLELPESRDDPEPDVEDQVDEDWEPDDCRAATLVPPLVVTVLTFTGMYAINILFKHTYNSLCPN